MPRGPDHPNGGYVENVVDKRAGHCKDQLFHWGMQLSAGHMQLVVSCNRSMEVPASCSLQLTGSGPGRVSGSYERFYDLPGFQRQNWLRTEESKAGLGHLPKIVVFS